MPNFSGIWSAAQQFQARGQNIWPKPPDAPTGVTGTAGNAQVSVAFSAPSCTGKYPAGVTTYTATSTPGCFTASGASSPLVVTGLTNCTAYTFKVKATGSNGLVGPCSAASGSVTPVVPLQVAYTTPGTYTFVAPSGLNPSSVSVVAIGGGGGGGNGSSGGGGLGYKNNYAVTAGNSYTVVVGAGARCTSYSLRVAGGDSYFVSTAVVKGGGGNVTGTNGGNYVGDGGGNGGAGNGTTNNRGGGGAGGYAGNGGGARSPGAACSGAAGGGGPETSSGAGGGGGGGVGILGKGGTGGYPPGYPCCCRNKGGYAGSGGTNGGNGGTGGGAGGLYGGGGGGPSNYSCAYQNPSQGGNGAVRIIYSRTGVTRTFPSTNTGDL